MAYTDNTLSFPGEYKIGQSVLLIKTAGKSYEAIDIKSFCSSMSIFQSIDEPFMFGTLTVIDPIDMYSRFPIMGNELLSFKVRTPFTGVVSSKDEINSDELLFTVYKISNKVRVSASAQTYTLHFISYEGLRNTRNRISKAYDGRYSDAVIDICKRYLKTTKNINYDRTRGTHKIVIPYYRPIDAIDMISERSLGDDVFGGSYYFYETPEGFNFRTIDSMTMDLNTFEDKPVKFKYTVNTLQKSSPVSGLEKDIIEAQFTAYKTKFFPNQDHIENAKFGMYAARTLTVDTFNKRVLRNKFDYLADNDFYSLPHVVRDTAFEEAYTSKRSVIPDNITDIFETDNSQVDGRDKKAITEYDETRIYVIPDSYYTHNNHRTYDLNKIVARREHIKQAHKNITVEIEVPGNTHIHAGDVIDLDFPSTEKYNVNTIGTDKDHYSGRYLVNSVRHVFNLLEKSQNTSNTILRLTKDVLDKPIGKSTLLTQVLEIEKDAKVRQLGTLNSDIFDTIDIAGKQVKDYAIASSKLSSARTSLSSLLDGTPIAKTVAYVKSAEDTIASVKSAVTNIPDSILNESKLKTITDLSTSAINASNTIRTNSINTFRETLVNSKLGGFISTGYNYAKKVVGNTINKVTKSLFG